MTLMAAILVTLGLMLFCDGQFGWAACAWWVGAFVLWWADQPDDEIDSSLAMRDEQRFRAKYPKGK